MYMYMHALSLTNSHSPLSLSLTFFMYDFMYMHVPLSLFAHSLSLYSSPMSLAYHLLIQEHTVIMYNCMYMYVSREGEREYMKALEQIGKATYMNFLSHLVSPQPSHDLLFQDHALLI